MSSEAPPEGERLKGGTLFSGIGAPEVAAPWIDWRWSADIDDFANAVRAHHWPEVPNLGDVAAIREPDPVDIIVFGSPCQSFSVVGKRLGLEDPRGNLALVALDLVARVRPTWIVWENVPGVRSSFSGSEHAACEVRSGPVCGWAEADESRDFASFLSTARECGYLGCWRSYDAQYAGLAQRRERVFFVGYLGDWRPPAAVLFEPESLRWNPAPRREAGEGAAGASAARAAISSGHGWWDDSDIGATLRAQDSITKADTLIAHSLRAEGFDASEDGTGRGTPIIPFDTTQITSPGNYSNPRPGDPCHPLTAGGHAPAMAFNWQSGGDCRGLDPQPLTMALQREQTPAALQGPMVRRLTPREAERLQGFPDDFTLIPWRGGMAPDGRRYRALGNSMAAPVVGWVLDRIQKFGK